MSLFYSKLNFGYIVISTTVFSISDLIIREPMLLVLKLRALTISEYCWSFPLNDGFMLRLSGSTALEGEPFVEIIVSRLPLVNSSSLNFLIVSKFTCYVIRGSILSTKFYSESV